MQNIYCTCLCSIWTVDMDVCCSLKEKVIVVPFVSWHTHCVYCSQVCLSFCASLQSSRCESVYRYSLFVVDKNDCKIGCVSHCIRLFVCHSLLLAFLLLITSSHCISSFVLSVMDVTCIVCSVLWVSEWYIYHWAMLVCDPLASGDLLATLSGPDLAQRWPFLKNSVYNTPSLVFRIEDQSSPGD